MDESVTMRDPRVEARVASSAYAQARALLEAQPEISAADLVERLRQRSVELAGALGEDPVARALDARHEPGPGSTSGFADAAAAARNSINAGSSPPTEVGSP
jgi:hypothetical protein